LEFVVLHELGHIVNNHSVSNLIFYGLKTTFISLVAEVFKVPAGVIENIIGFLKFLITFSGQKTIEEQITAEKEIEADRYAVRLQGKKEPALSVLTKITNGNIDLPTHVTVDGNFIIPAITARERIKAIEAS
jgi:Zn-dependent protease with chaperone function